MNMCKTCKFFNKTKFVIFDCGKLVSFERKGSDGLPLGVCRVNPPVIDGPWPTVCEGDWCGAWVLNE